MYPIRPRKRIPETTQTLTIVAGRSSDGMAIATATAKTLKEIIKKLIASGAASERNGTAERASPANARSGRESVGNARGRTKSPTIVQVCRFSVLSCPPYIDFLISPMSNVANAFSFIYILPNYICI